MRNYLLFGGDIYYARGGMNDLIREFDTADEALKFAHSIAGTQFDEKHIGWWHVFDVSQKIIMEKSETDPY